MNPLSIIRQFIKGLTKENEPWKIGLGIAFGFAIGIIPKSNLTAQFLFVLMMCTKANIPFAMLSIFLFSAISPLSDNLADPIGFWVLNAPQLSSFFTKLYNMPFLPWTDFNNSVVLGGLILSMILFFPVYLAGKRAGLFYNDKFKEKISNSKIVKSLKASWLFDWYFKE